MHKCSTPEPESSSSSLHPCQIFTCLGMYRHVPFYCALLYCTSQILSCGFDFFSFFFLIESLWQDSRKAVDAIFPTPFANFVSLSHFGDSHTITNLCVIICVMVIFDQ